MRVNIDVKALEWGVGTFLCQDAVAMDELFRGEDIHTKNQLAFNLPSRLIAKLFIFRLVYGGTEWAYAKDHEFKHVSSDPKYWRDVIEAFYSKYRGWAKWHRDLMQTVQKTGELIMPTGRIFTYSRVPNVRGELEWPRTTILNYPVQGCSADFMSIYRIHLYRRLRGKYGRDILLFVSTVHDSIELDCIPSIVDDVLQIAVKLANDMPKLIEQAFGFKYNVPFVVETELMEDGK